MSIAKAVHAKFEATGELLIPDGHKGTAFSLPLSSDKTDQRRSLHIVFEDGSEIGIEIGDARVAWTDAGEADMDAIDATLASLRS